MQSGIISNEMVTEYIRKAEHLLELGENVEAAKLFLAAYKIEPMNDGAIKKLVELLPNIGLENEANMMLDDYVSRGGNEPDLVTKYRKINGIVYKRPEYPVADDQLNILFVQNSPCIRNYKYASALRKAGHKVSLAYSDFKISQVYKNLDDNVYNECIKISENRDLWDLSESFDIIHCHNEPDIYTVALLAGNAPVIHDTHDLISLRDQNPNLKYFEGIANRGAHGRIYSTPYQMREAASEYGVKGISEVIYNYVSEDHIPSELLPKLSQKDGDIHIVYEGGIYVNNGRHRDFSDQFVELAERGYYVHIYPAAWLPDVAEYFSNFDRIIYNKPVSPNDLIREMSQFDLGIIPWNLQKGNYRFLASTIANKLFEYLAAGLPVATADITSYRDFFSNNPVGSVFHSIDDLEQKIPHLLNLTKQIDFSAQVYTYEGSIDKVINLYRKVIKNFKGVK